MQHTKSYNLKKPDPNDYADIQVINENMDKVDAQLTGLEQGKADLVDGREPEAQLPDLTDRLRNANLLDNWYFINPVNQRWITVQTDDDPNVDRWFTYSEGTNDFTLTVNADPY